MNIETINFTEDGRVKLIAYIQDIYDEMPNIMEKPAIIVCPGGGYQGLSDREAEAVALAYAGKGYQAFILKYSLKEHAIFPTPVLEGSKAIGIVRERAKEWHINPEHIAICGFSAGGHVAASVGVLAENRPNAMVLCYPCIDAHSWEKHDVLGNLMNRCLLGKEEYTMEELDQISLQNFVDEKTPPTFLWGTSDDDSVYVENILTFASALAKYNHQFECHIFDSGCHGLSLAQTICSSGRENMVSSDVAKWFDLSVEWLNQKFHWNGR